MRQTEFDEPEFLASLRRGEERAYRVLIRRFHGSLIGVAASIIGSRAQAEEVVQDAWLAVFSGIGAFEGRSSLVTWVFSIVLNRARTRATREGRLVGLPALMEGTPPGGRAVDASQFKPDGHWIDAPRLWDEIDPERIVAGRQLWDFVMEAIDRLPSGQRAVIILRDIEGCEAEEACTLLGITAENQRVLLHRARGRIRQTIDTVIGETRPAVVTAWRRRRGNAAARVANRLVAWAVWCRRHVNADPTDWLTRIMCYPRELSWHVGIRLEGRHGTTKSKNGGSGAKSACAGRGDRAARGPAGRTAGRRRQPEPPAARGGLEPHVRPG